MKVACGPTCPQCSLVATGVYVVPSIPTHPGASASFPPLILTRHTLTPSLVMPPSENLTGTPVGPAIWTVAQLAILCGPVANWLLCPGKGNRLAGQQCGARACVVWCDVVRRDTRSTAAHPGGSLVGWQREPYAPAIRYGSLCVTCVELWLVRIIHK